MDHLKVFSSDNPRLYTTVFCREKEKLSTELDGETIILDMESGNYNQLNQVGSTIWNMLAQPVTFEAILEGVLSKYDTTEEQCKEEILSFLKDLADNNLIKIYNEIAT